MDPKQLEAISLAVSEAVNKHIDEIKSSIQTESKNNQKIQKEVQTTEKSVMNFKNHKAPFVTIGTNMEKFVNNLKSMISGAPVLTSEQEKAAFNAGTNADGGFTIPEELEASLLSYAEEEGVVRPRATKISMKSDTWKKNKLDQSSSQFGGVTISWVGESDTTTDTKFSMGQISLVAKKALMLTTESREIINDSAIDFANYVVNIFGRALAYFEDDAFLNGTGIGQPLGVLADTNIPVVHRKTANQIVYEDINKMFYALKPVFRRQAIWIGSTGAIQYIDGLVDGVGKPLLSESLKSTTPTTLKGKGFVETEKCAALGSKGDLAFVDFSWYYIGDREGTTVDASVHDRFRYDEITIRLVKRVDGMMAMKEAAVILDIPAA